MEAKATVLTIFLIGLVIMASSVGYLYVNQVTKTEKDEDDNNDNNDDDNGEEIIIDEEEVLVTIRGNVKNKVNLTLEELNSSKYRQVKALFKFKNQLGDEWYIEYTGTTLWSILEAEDILESDSETFLFNSTDGYLSPEPLSILDVARDYENQVILAFSREGVSLDIVEGPIRAIIDHEAIENLEPEYYNNQFAVKHLEYVEIY